MAEGRSMAEWGRLSHLLCLVANVNRDPRARPRPYTPADFDPHAARGPGRDRGVPRERWWDAVVAAARSRGRGLIETRRA